MHWIGAMEQEDQREVEVSQGEESEVMESGEDRLEEVSRPEKRKDWQEEEEEEEEEEEGWEAEERQ